EHGAVRPQDRDAPDAAEEAHGAGERLPASSLAMSSRVKYSTCTRAPRSSNRASAPLRVVSRASRHPDWNSTWLEARPYSAPRTTGTPTTTRLPAESLMSKW